MNRFFLSMLAFSIIFLTGCQAQNTSIEANANSNVASVSNVNQSNQNILKQNPEKGITFY